jgi:ADP-ribose pyrophosphatase YjhB (NUDIX family)
MPETYPIKPIVTVSLVEKNNNVMFVHMQNGPDGHSGLFLPNDILHQGEDPHEGARRVAKEQAGVDIKELKLLDVESFEGEDHTWHLALHYRAEVPDRKAIASKQALGETRWSEGKLPADAEVAHGGWYNSIAKRALEYGKR